MIQGTVASDIMLPVGSTVVLPPVLPVDCICPNQKSCGMRQTLDRDRLGLGPGMYQSLEDFDDPFPADLLDRLPLSADLKLELGSPLSPGRQRLLRIVSSL